MTRILCTYASFDYPLELGHIEKFVTDTILRHAPLGHHSEVAWALWLSISLGLTLNKNVAQALSKMENSICVLLTLHLASEGFIPTGLNTKDWESKMNSSSLRDRSWLLAYEADFKGWLKVNPPGFVSSDPYFSYLRTRNVSFYEHEARTIPVSIKDVSQESVASEAGRIDTNILSMMSTGTWPEDNEFEYFDSDEHFDSES